MSKDVDLVKSKCDILDEVIAVLATDDGEFTSIQGKFGSEFALIFRFDDFIFIDHVWNYMSSLKTEAFLLDFQKLIFFSEVLQLKLDIESCQASLSEAFRQSVHGLFFTAM